jgi:glucokinase
MSQIIAVDFGGTNIRAASFDSPKPPPSEQSKTPTQASDGPEAVLERLKQSIRALFPEDGRDVRIGVGAPGPLDPRKGVVLEAPNLPGWKNIPLQETLEKTFDCPVAIGNDANVAALGEWRFGAGVGTDNLIYLTISTGIGGGIIADGRLLLGAQGLAAEVGHMTVDPEGPMCGCGHKGHLEAIASGTAIARRAQELIDQGHSSSLLEVYQAQGTLTAVEVGQAAQSGDELALEVIAYAGRAIGRQLADLAHAFNPKIFILGGGVSQLGPLLFDPVHDALQAHVMHPAYTQDLKVVPAALGDDAGLIGAMVLASQ